MTVAEKIEIAQASQFLAANDVAKGGLYGGGISTRLPRLLYMVRKNVERMYSLNPSAASLTKTANYMYSLCAPFSLRAQAILGNGGSIAPGGGGGSTSVIYPIFITSADFESDGVSYNNPDIVGDNLIIFVNEYVQQWLSASGSTFSYTATGIIMNIPDFDANVNSWSIVIEKFNN